MKWHHPVATPREAGAGPAERAGHPLGRSGRGRSRAARLPETRRGDGAPGLRSETSPAPARLLRPRGCALRGGDGARAGASPSPDAARESSPRTYCSRSVCSSAGWGSVHGAEVASPGWKVCGALPRGARLGFLPLPSAPRLRPGSPRARSRVRVPSSAGMAVMMVMIGGEGEGEEGRERRAPPKGHRASGGGGRRGGERRRGRKSPSHLRRGDPIWRERAEDREAAEAGRAAAPPGC